MHLNLPYWCNYQFSELEAWKWYKSETQPPSSTFQIPWNTSQDFGTYSDSNYFDILHSILALFCRKHFLLKQKYGKICNMIIT